MSIFDFITFDNDIDNINKYIDQNCSSVKNLNNEYLINKIRPSSWDNKLQELKKLFNDECYLCNIKNIKYIIKFVYEIFLINPRKFSTGCEYIEFNKLPYSLYDSIISSLEQMYRYGYFDLIKIYNIIGKKPINNNDIKFYKYVPFDTLLGKEVLSVYTNELIHIMLFIYNNIYTDELSINQIKLINNSFIYTQSELIKFKDNILRVESGIGESYHDKNLSFIIFKSFRKIVSIIHLFDPIRLTRLNFNLSNNYMIEQHKQKCYKNITYFNIKNYIYYISKYKKVLNVIMLCRYNYDSSIYKFPWELTELLLSYILSIMYDEYIH